MKRFFLITTFLGIVLSINAQQDEKKEEFNPFAVKSGYIKYELSGDATGFEELWWDDFGNKRRRFTKSSSEVTLLGMTQKEEVHELVIFNDGVVYSIDYIEERNTKEYVHCNTESGMTEKEAEELSEEMFEAMGGKRLGKQKILGYECEGVSVLGFTSWIYKGLLLKSEGEILGIEYAETAVKFTPNKKIAASQFEPPQGVEFEELNSQSDVRPNDNSGNRNNQQNVAEDEEPEEMFTKYPFDVFSSKVKAFKHGTYVRLFVKTTDGVHSAMFTKAVGKGSISIVAASRKNSARWAEILTFDDFKHNGVTCWYDDTNNTSTLLLSIDKYNTYIMIDIDPAVSRSQTLKIADKFNF